MKLPRPKESDVNWPRKCTDFCSDVDGRAGRVKMSILGMKTWALVGLLGAWPFVCDGQETEGTSATRSPSPVSNAASAATSAPDSDATTSEEEIVPTFETQKLARTYILDIPAPRGQITDRNGAPLAQNKLSYNLAINFPTPLDFSDAQAVSFAREKIEKAAKILGRSIKIPDET